MTQAATLTTIDFLTHSKVAIAADAATIWPEIVTPGSWRAGQQLVPIGGDAGRLGERFQAIYPEAPETPLFFVENVELIAETRRTIRLEELDGRVIGFATWELTPAEGGTVVAYDVYCRGAMLPPGQSTEDLMAVAQRGMDDGLLALKAFIER
jgi:hypothetical protein